MTCNETESLTIPTELFLINQYVNKEIENTKVKIRKIFAHLANGPDFTLYRKSESISEKKMIEMINPIVQR